MVSKIHTTSLLGYDGRTVIIETDKSNSLPGIVIVGLGDKSVDEAKERIRGALRNSGFPIPPKRFTVNLVPADLPKRGSNFDLGIAVSILQSSGQLPENLPVAHYFGELGLDGACRGVSGALVAAQTARAQGIPRLYISSEIAKDAALISGLEVYPVASLKQLIAHLLDEVRIAPLPETQLPSPKKTQTGFSEIVGQQQAKRALSIALAGGHNVLMYGPPGSGKTMLARAAASLLPPLTKEEYIDIRKIHSLDNDSRTIARPFRSPHHTASHISLVGGGQWPKPGEVSLAHHGVLFLDEIAEFSRQTLEVLRQPLEDGFVTVTRAQHSVAFPARFILIAACNPCPCGYAGDPAQQCVCTQSQLIHYRNKLSGPLLDRIDMHIRVGRIETQAITAAVNRDTTNYQSWIARARTIQSTRFAKDGFHTNSAMSTKDTQSHCALTKDAQHLLTSASEKLHLSTRSYFRTIKVARTVADMSTSSTIEAPHIAEALQFRQTSLIEDQTLIKR